MTSTRNDPDSPENAEATRQNEREAFALQQQAKADQKRPVNLITNVVLSGLRRQLVLTYESAELLVRTDAFTPGLVREGLIETKICLERALDELDKTIKDAQ